MPNTCQIIIKTGPNAGKKCFQVGKRCRHKKEYVCGCGFKTYHQHSFNRHLESFGCTPATDKQIKILKQKSEQSKPKSQPTVKLAPKLKIKSPDKKPLTRQQKTPIVDENERFTMAEFQNFMMANLDLLNKRIGEIAEQPDINSKLQQLNEKITEIADKPTVINNTYNIAIMAPNFYQELETKMGQRETVKLLTSSAITNDPMSILKILYFGGNDPNEYPIASKNGRYRYLNDEGTLIETGGDQVGKLVSTRIQKAMSYATGKLIRNTMHDTDKLYDTYDLGTIQANIYNFPTEYVHKELSHITENPAHPFFMDGVSVLCLE